MVKQLWSGVTVSKSVYDQTLGTVRKPRLVNPEDRLAYAIREAKLKGDEPFQNDFGSRDYKDALQMVAQGRLPESVVAFYTQPARIIPVRVVEKDSDLDLDGRTQNGNNGAADISFRLRDQTAEQIMSYRGERGVVVYGTFIDSRHRACHTNRLYDRHLKISRHGRKEVIDMPSTSEVQKVTNLLEAISSPNPNWAYARELYEDIRKLRKSDIFYNRSLYTGMLSSIGAIIEQELPVVARLETHHQLQIPIGYSIEPSNSANGKRPIGLSTNVQVGQQKRDKNDGKKSKTQRLLHAHGEMDEHLRLIAEISEWEKEISPT